MYRVLDIIRGTTVDGPGFRTAIYLAGCRHCCKDCHNPESWNEENGKLMSAEEILTIIREENFDVTLTGGDPLYNPINIKHLISMIKDDNRNLWIYTGYTWEEILSLPELLDAVSKADVLVDGRFDNILKDRDLTFKGSSNQRIIDIQQSLLKKELVILQI